MARFSNIIVSLAFMFLMVTLPLESGEFNLLINDVSGTDTPWPTIAGLPFPKGELKDPSNIRIVSMGSEVSSQVDVAARWPDGSLRWVLASFTSRPGAGYKVEYGKGITRGVYPNSLKVVSTQRGFTVDTGQALYEFDNELLLPEKGWLLSGEEKILVMKDSGNGAYIVDNSGRISRVAGPLAQVENKVLKEGPGRFTVKRSGWYVTESGERVARAETWFYFWAGTPFFKITHKLVVTEDTNKLWFRDYGLRFNTPELPSQAYFSTGNGSESTGIVKLTPGKGDAFLVQKDYPHFAQRESIAYAGVAEKGASERLEKFPVAGDWAYGDYGNYGISLVMPWLAERYPKELSFGTSGAKIILWSGRSGHELDYRTGTLIEEYWQDWVKQGGMQHVKPNGTPKNAQGIARTHDMWIMPRKGGYDQEIVRKNAVAASRQVLAMAEPSWLCASQALGWPMHHEDPARFPAEESAIREYWRRFIIPLEAFPMTGFISWGSYPDISYRVVNKKIMSTFARLKSLSEYGLRQVPVRLYARSGDRMYYEYTYKFGRFTGDYGIAHWNAPGKQRGGYISKDVGGLPEYWEGNTHPYGIIDGEIRHWLFEYYLTGDEYTLDLVKMTRESAEKAGWPAGGVISILRELQTFSMMDMDESSFNATREFLRRIVDLESENGIRDNGGYGPLYKDERDTFDFIDYYLETGDELAKSAFIKLIDHRYYFDRRYNPVAHRNYDAYTHSIAYMITGEERYRKVVEQTVGDALYYLKQYPLENTLKDMPQDPLEWKGLPDFLGQHEYHLPFLGIPTALKLYAEKGKTGKRAPFLIKPMDIDTGSVVFPHRTGRETRISLFFTTLRKEVHPVVFPYGDGPGRNNIQGIRIEMRKRKQWPPSLVVRNDDIYSASITIPPEISSGLYELSLGGSEPFTLIEITGDKAALYAPEGFWSPSGSPIQRVGEGSFGRAGEGMPMYFRVPQGLQNLEILFASPARLKRPDGSVAVDISDSNIGRLRVPVEGKSGVWCIEPLITNFKGQCPPAFFRLFNVEPVVSFGIPDFLPDEITGRPKTVTKAPDAKKEGYVFGRGINGDCLELSGGRTLTFTTGQKRGDGGYAYFPGMKGTAEFWFKPDLPTQEVPIIRFQNKDMSFINGPHIDLRHRYWLRGGRNIYSMLQAEIKHEESEKNPVGFQGRFFFRGDEWVHIAYTWDFTGMKEQNGNMSIFLNGSRIPFNSAPYGVARFDPKKKFNIKTYEKESSVVIGPFEGAIDLLRISDSVRYEENFKPDTKKLQLDGKTKVLFLFDGNMKGITVSGEEIFLK